MKTNLKTFLSLALIMLCGVGASAKKTSTTDDVRIDPPYWWAGMKNPSVQLLVHSPQIRDAEPSISYPGISIDSVVRLDSPNYQIIYLNVSRSATPGKMDIFFKNGKESMTVKYELKQRDGVQPTPFSSADVLYLIMPDRFADGDTTNNDVEGLKFRVPVDRSNPSGRHGGDLKGIGNHPECRQVSVMAGVADRDIPKGTVLEVHGHHHAIEGLVPELLELSSSGNVAPFYLLNGAVLKNDIKKGEPVTTDDVDITGQPAYRFYAEGLKL